jgi:hypothetical protein
MANGLSKLNLPYLAAGAVFIVIIIVAIGGASITGNSTHNHACTDSDYGIDKNTKGLVRFRESTRTLDLRDSCDDENSVIEYYCSSPLNWKSTVEDCAYGQKCVNGYCKN